MGSLREAGLLGTAAALTLLKLPANAGQKASGDMSILNVLLVLLILAFFGVIPMWGYSSNWGYAPSGGLLLLIVVVLIAASSGRLRA